MPDKHYFIAVLWVLLAIACGALAVAPFVGGNRQVAAELSESGTSGVPRNLLENVDGIISEELYDAPRERLFSEIDLRNILNIPVQNVSGKRIVADLDAMTISLLEGGSIIETFSIISKGKPGSPWETPAGEYSVLMKEESHFSSIGEVWMPWSMQFFGNFFIHGWPYYPDGSPVPQGYSGGCIRLSADDAKKVYAFAQKGTTVTVRAGPLSNSAYESMAGAYYRLGGVSRAPYVSAQAYLVADLLNGEVILEKNIDGKLPIASVTKLMTALVSLEVVNQFQITTISRKAVETESAAGGFSTGEKIITGNLIYPLLLQSSNDAAVALGEHVGNDTFLKAMNDKATSIGLTGTYYTDGSGLSTKNVSTARDLFLLARYLFINKRHVLDVTKQDKKAVERWGSTQAHVWTNRNYFVSNGTQGYLGGKTGFTDAARHTLVSVFSLPVSEFEERPVAVILLGSDWGRLDAEKLIAYVDGNVFYRGGRLTEKAIQIPEIAALSPKEPPKREVSLLFIGDIMLDRGVERSIERTGKNDFSFAFREAPALKNADITFANLEGPVSDKGREIGNLYSFRMNPKAARAIRDAGIDVVSLANNHLGDWGRAALEDTLLRLIKGGVVYTGAGLDEKETEEMKIFIENDTSLGFLSFSDVGPVWLSAGKELSGIALASSTERIKQIVTENDPFVDVLVTSFHWGDEYETTPNARQRALARAAIDAGAELVIGHHPHVSQPVELYKNGLIAYSLGNFIFDQSFSEATMKGTALSVKIKDGAIESFSTKDVPINQFFQPMLATSSAVSSIEN